MNHNRHPLLVLFDTGAATSLIRTDIARRLGCIPSITDPISLKGAISPHSTITNQAVTLYLYNQNFSLEIAVYVTDAIREEVIVGNPIIREYRELLGYVQRGDEETHESYIDDQKSNEMVVKGSSNYSWGPLGALAARDHYQLEFKNKKLKKLPSSENKKSLEDVDSELCEVIPPLASLGCDPSSKRDIFDACILEISTVVYTDSDSFSRLPPHLKDKFETTVANDLPPNPNYDRGVFHDIEIKTNARLPHLQPYPITPKKESVIDELIQDLLKKNFIVPSRAPCSSPVVLVPKKDNEFRLCVDYRELNKVTVKDPFPLPRIDSLLARIGDAAYFTTIDLHSGYHQIPMNPKDQFKTAFVTPNGKYEYTVMPFGLVNSPSTFARYMADLFRGIKYVGVYLDDILIFSTSEEEHFNHIDNVLSILQKEKLVAKRKKCHFNKDKVQYLGYSISPNIIEPLQDKCKAIEKFPRPTTVKEAQRFLGMINYYRRFIPHCSEVANAIQNYISKKEDWGTYQEDAFKLLKSYLTSKPTLVTFKTGHLYRLTTDASKLGVGAVLEEVDRHDRIIGIVSYFSKSYHGAEKNYPAGELELLGIKKTLEHFKYLLHGHPFTLRTDHISLLALKNKGESSDRTTKFLKELAEYDFKFQYLKGKDNVVADAISRAHYTISAIDDILTIQPEEWVDDYPNDPLGAAVLIHMKGYKPHQVRATPRTLVKKLQKKLETAKTFSKHFTISTEGLIYYKDKILVPQSKRHLVLELFHDNNLFGGHFGQEATYRKTQVRYYWPNMYKEVIHYVNSCVQCQLCKAHRIKQQGLLTPLPIGEGRWIDISIDFALGLPESFRGNNMILVVVDRFSKRCHLIACNKSMGSHDTFNNLFRFIFSAHGFPRSITSDRDVRFTSYYYKELTERLGIKLTMSSANHPQTDGQTERTIQVINRMIKSYANTDHRHWDDYLPMIEFVYNSTYHHSIQCTPFEADLGYTPSTPSLMTTKEVEARTAEVPDMIKHIEAIGNRTRAFLEETQHKMEEQNNDKRTPLLLQVGDFVLVHRQAYFKRGKYWKVQPIFVGPFKVVKKVQDNAYEIDLPSHRKIHRVINVQHLKKFIRRADQYPLEPPRTSPEKILRAKDVIAVVGYEEQGGIYYCHMRDVDPTLCVEYTKEEFDKVPRWIQNSLLANFKQLLETN